MTPEELRIAQNSLEELKSITTQLSWIMLSCKHDSPSKMHRVTYVSTDVWIPIGILRRYIYRTYLKRVEELRKLGVDPPELSKELREAIVTGNVIHEFQKDTAGLRLAHAVQRFRNLKALGRATSIRSTEEYGELVNAWDNYIHMNPHAEINDYMLTLPLKNFDYELPTRVMP